MVYPCPADDNARSIARDKLDVLRTSEGANQLPGINPSTQSYAPGIAWRGRSGSLMGAAAGEHPAGVRHSAPRRITAAPALARSRGAGREAPINSNVAGLRPARCNNSSRTVGDGYSSIDRGRVFNDATLGDVAPGMASAPQRPLWHACFVATLYAPSPGRAARTAGVTTPQHWKWS